MKWTRLPKEDIIYINQDDWVLNDPITKRGTLYIERETNRCKVGNGQRYTSIPYTPWSISVSAASTISVKNLTTTTTGLDTSKRYIWNGSTTFSRGYIISYVNSTWTQQIPEDNCFAWVVDLYQLKIWDGVQWNNVDVNTHNIQYGLEGGDASHYYHLSEHDYIEVTRLSWRYPVNEIVTGDFPTGISDHYRIAISESVLSSNNTYNYKGRICEYINGSWIYEPLVLGQTIVNLFDGGIYTWDGQWIKVNTNAFANLSDVINTNPQEGDLYVRDADGNLVNKRPADVISILSGVLLAPTNTPNVDEILFSDGSGGTYTAGFKVNQYNQLDLVEKQVKNAIIDCGAFYA